MEIENSKVKESNQNEDESQSFSLPDSDGLTLNFVAKTSDQIRNEFLSKLAQKKVWLTP